ncbi:MAG TPA: hypothetical protein VFM12_02435 [Gemmatimonadales bacterium]|jgi:hypothetical protein|nr:hypothetical protein [Gemmatimonadales bacterium]
MPLAIRLRALFLTVLFVGGSFVVPVVDGALFHSGRIHSVASIHFDTRGDLSCHAERCLLDAPIAGASLEATPPSPIRVSAEAFATATVRPLDIDPSQNTPTALHSRAPPLHIA